MHFFLKLADRRKVAKSPKEEEENAPRSEFRSPQCRLISENRAFAGFSPHSIPIHPDSHGLEFDLIGSGLTSHFYDVGRKAPRLRGANDIGCREPVTGERLRPDWHGFAAHQDSTPRWIAWQCDRDRQFPCERGEILRKTKV
jgi:hypothetical protein